MLEEKTKNEYLDELLEVEKGKKRIEMAKAILLFLIFIALLSFHFHSPCPCHAKGMELNKHVEDQYGYPVEGAYVVVEQLPGHITVAEGYTDEHGWFNTTLDYGHYKITASYMGASSWDIIWLCDDTTLNNVISIPAEGHGYGQEG